MSPTDHRPILVAVDFSSDSEAALLHAVKLAAETGAPLVVLHVVHDPAEAPGKYARVDSHGRQLTIEAAAGEMQEEFLASMRERHPDVRALGALDTRMVVGLPETRILEVAGKLGAREIVMGSRGLIGLERLMLGSTAKRLLKLSSISVTVVTSEPDA